MKSDQEIVGWRWWHCWWPNTGEPRLWAPFRSNDSEWLPRRMPPPAMHDGTTLWWCNLCGFDLRENPGRCPGDLDYAIAAQAAASMDMLELHAVHYDALAVGCSLSERDRVGYHAYRSSQEFQNSINGYGLMNMDAPHVVVGTVSLWGTVCVYKEGYRAQYAYPRTLYVADGLAAMRRALAQAYGVEVYPRSALPFWFRPRT